MALSTANQATAFNSIAATATVALGGVVVRGQMAPADVALKPAVLNRPGDCPGTPRDGGAVSQRLKKPREHGSAALDHRILPGPMVKLVSEQRAQLPPCPPMAPKRMTSWATCRPPSAAIVITREFGAQHSPVHVSRLPRQISWSMQKPLHRATQRNEVLITKRTTAR